MSESTKSLCAAFACGVFVMFGVGLGVGIAATRSIKAPRKRADILTLVNDDDNDASCCVAQEESGIDLCRGILERHFNKPFPPPMETSNESLHDVVHGYCKELKIAFIFLSRDSCGTNADLKTLMNRESDATKVCVRNGIRLVVIPNQLPRSALSCWIENHPKLKK